jgi:hypothetical protein
VKLVVEAPGAENVPLAADHQYPSSFGFGPVAVAVSTTELPTVVSIGLAIAVVQAAQPPLGEPPAHCSRSVTSVGMPESIENGAEPEQVKLPSLEVVVKAIR